MYRSNTGELHMVLVRGNMQRALDLRPKPQNVPVQAIGQAHRAVSEAVNVGQG